MGVEGIRDMKAAERIRAVYERGVFRPLDPVPFREGAEVEVMSCPGHVADSSGSAAAELLDAIAALPAEGDSPGIRGRDHDRYLYPNGSSN